jgi:HD superfamily phosphohydrolase
MDIEALISKYPTVGPFITGVHGVTERRLAPLNARDEKSLRQFHAKSILDPVIGYVHLRRWEVVLLESEVVQRLRRIRQLGLAYLVYPTLGYSRFEHTVGVLGRVEQILQRLKQVHSPEDPDSHDTEVLALIERHSVSLRLAALFHDVGHCVYSHVSERSMSNLEGAGTYPAVKYICEVFTEALQRKKMVPIAEVLSLVTLSSPSIRDLLVKLPIQDKSEENIERWIAEAQSFIAGMPSDSRGETIFLAQILSSGFDADKLDYMTREAYFSNIPLGIDEVRLVDRLKVFHCTAGHLPRDIAYLKEILPRDGTCKVLGFAKGGQFAFEEFCLARVSLHDKIYLHQKIRSAEGLLLACLHSFAASNVALQEVHSWLQLEESDFERSDARPGLNASPDDLFAQTFKTAEELGFVAIRKRQLFHRAFAFGVRNGLSDVVSADASVVEQPVTLKFFDWVRKNSDVLRNGISDELKRICVALNQTPPKDSISRIVIDVPNHRRVQQGQESVYFERPNMLPLRWTLPLDQIVQYYENRSLAYIFAAREVCPFVALAAERVIYNWERAGLMYVQEEGVSPGLVKDVSKWRSVLSASGYYDDCPPLKPVSKYLQSFAAQERIDRCVNNLMRFRSWRGQRITPAHVRAFAAQFEEKLHEAVLCLIEQLVMVEPSEIAAEVVLEYNEIRTLNAENVAIVPVGNLTDSATHLLYELKNHPNPDIRQLGPNITALQASTIFGADYLVFFDDNTNSGQQVLNVFADWLGVALPDAVNLGEKHVDALPVRAQEKLKKMKMSFVFGVAPEGSGSRIQALLEEHLHIPRGNIRVRVGRNLRKDNRILSGDSPAAEIPKRTELRQFLDTIGREILGREGKSPERAEARALGEDRAEALIVFPYNTPTMTITPLWCRGNYSKGEWIPLVERRRNVRMTGKLSGEDA